MVLKPEEHFGKCNSVIIDNIKNEIDDILYDIYVECGDIDHVNIHGFNSGHYLVEDISSRIEKYFLTLNN